MAAIIHEGTYIGPYVVERVLPGGEGGFALVVVARHYQKSGERVAIKIAKVWVKRKDQEKTAELIDSYERALRNEVETLRQLYHPGIVRIYPIPLDDRRHSYMAREPRIKGKPWYFVMEYLSGGSVEDMIKRHRRLDVPLAVEIVQQVAGALDYLHGKGFAHLDIKPSNILLRKPISQETRPEAVLVDFGAAQKALRRAEIEAGALVYLPPERVRIVLGDYPSDAVKDKAAADIYSLGVSFYYMVTGKLPFKGKRSSVTTAILKKQVTPPSSIVPEIRNYKRLEELILSMLDKQPDARPKAHEVVKQLDQVVSPPRFQDVGHLQYSIPNRWQRLALIFMILSFVELGGVAYLGYNQIIRGSNEKETKIVSTIEIRESMATQITVTSFPTPTITTSPTKGSENTPLPTRSPIPGILVENGTPTPTLEKSGVEEVAVPTPTSTPTEEPPTATPVPTHTPTPTPRPTSTPTPTP